MFQSYNHHQAAYNTTATATATAANTTAATTTMSCINQLSHLCPEAYYNVIISFDTYIEIHSIQKQLQAAAGIWIVAGLSVI
jgi:hypothetical protein